MPDAAAPLGQDEPSDPNAAGQVPPSTGIEARSGASGQLHRTDDEVVDAELIERAADRAADRVVRKLIFELRETNPAAPPAEDLVLLAQNPQVYSDFMELWNKDLDRRWEYSRAEQAHEQAMQAKQQQAQAELDHLEMSTLARTLTDAPKFALTFGLAGLLVALLVAVFASPVAGAVIAGLDITTGIGLFLYSKTQPSAATAPSALENEAA